MPGFSSDMELHVGRSVGMESLVESGSDVKRALVGWGDDHLGSGKKDDREGRSVLEGIDKLGVVACPVLANALNQADHERVCQCHSNSPGGVHAHVVPGAPLHHGKNERSRGATETRRQN